MFGLIILTIAILLIILSEYIHPSKKDSKKKGVYIIIYILLVLSMGSRDAQMNYGSDLNNYYRLYNLCIESSLFENILNNSSMEKGYLYLNWILSSIFKWPQFIIFFQAAFCCGATLYFIYKHSTDITLSILGFMSLGLMQFYLTGFRQSIAISICIIALDYALRNKKITFLIFIAIATSIHQTAIVFLPAIFLVNIKINRFSFMLDVIFIIVLSILTPHLMDMGNSLFQRAYSGNFIGNALGGAVNVLLGIITAIFLISRKRSCWEATNITENNTCNLLYKRSLINYRMIHLLIIGTGIYAMRYQSLVLERISLYFAPVLFVLLPQALQSVFKERDYKIARMSVECAFLFLIYWRLGRYEYNTF